MKRLLLLTTAVVMTAGIATTAQAQLIIQPTIVTEPERPVAIAPYRHHFHNWEDFRQRRVHEEHFDDHRR